MGMVKGRTNNPNGRPKKGTALTDLLRTHLDKKGAEGVTYKQLLVQKLTEMALSGQFEAIKYIFERSDGKIPEVAYHNVTSTTPPLVQGYSYDNAIAPLAPPSLEGEEK